MIEMKLMGTYFEKIKTGEKIYEVRLYDEKRKNLKIGDEIIFSKLENLTEKLNVIIEEIKNYKTFSELLNDIPLCYLGLKNLNQSMVKKIYYDIYSKEDEEMYGVVAIKIKLINNIK